MVCNNGHFKDCYDFILAAKSLRGRSIYRGLATIIPVLLLIFLR